MLSLLSPLLLCLWCAVLEYGFILRFKGIFSGFWGFRVGLCWLGALRGLWGFCVREWLGGFMACGVSPSFCPFVFFSCPLVLLSLALLLGFVACFPAWLLLLVFGVACVVVVGFLSLSDGFRYKKKGRALRPFLRCLFALILSNINPYIFRLGFHKIRLYLHILSDCGRFLLSLPACVPALLHSSNTGRCFRGLPALSG